MAIVFALLFVTAIGVTNILGGITGKTIQTTVTLFLANTLALILVGVAVLIVGGEGHQSDILWGVLSGAFLVSGRLLLFRSFATRSFSETLPFFGALLAIAPVAAAVVQGDDVDAGTWTALAIAVLAIVLVSRADSQSLIAGLRKAWMPIAAGAVLGLNNVPVDHASGNRPLLVAFGANLSAALLLLPIVARSVRKQPYTQRTKRAIATMGILFALSAVSIALAFKYGALAPVSVIISLTPIPTLLFSVIFLDERPTKAQLTGIGLSALAVGLIALS